MMNYRLPYCVLLLSLIIGCTHRGADNAGPTFTPPAYMASHMLTANDVPGGTHTTWRDHLYNTTGCPKVDFNIDIQASHNADTANTTAVIDTEQSEVMQTMILNIIDWSHGQTFQAISEYMAPCDGITFEAPYSAMPTAAGALTESFALLPADQLPEGVIGYTSVITAADGTQRTFQRVVVALTDENGNPGLMVLTTAATGNQPSALTPLDLLDTALTKANATIDHTALNTSTPIEPVSEQPTTEQP